MSQKQAERLYQLLQERRSALSLADILQQLGISYATFKRALGILRQDMGVTVFSPSHGGYRLDPKDKHQIHINNHWLSPQELDSLIQSYQVLGALSKNAYLSRLIAPVLEKITSMVEAGSDPQQSYFTILSPHERRNNGVHLPVLIQAMQAQRQVSIHYAPRSNSAAAQRNISPQKLIRYRENWYVLAYCHSRCDLRTFACERILQLEISPSPLYTLAAHEVSQFIESVYGIFGGPPKHTAHITFLPSIAPWIQDEIWHPQQTLEPTAEGGLVLSLPLGENLSEITLDLLRYAGHIAHIEPAPLREQYIQNLQDALSRMLPQHQPPTTNPIRNQTATQTLPQNETQNTNK